MALIHLKAYKLTNCPFPRILHLRNSIPIHPALPSPKHILQSPLSHLLHSIHQKVLLVLPPSQIHPHLSMSITTKMTIISHLYSGPSHLIGPLASTLVSSLTIHSAPTILHQQCDHQKYISEPITQLLKFFNNSP